jgi:hypothetical protein
LQQRQRRQDRVVLRRALAQQAVRDAHRSERSAALQLARDPDGTGHRQRRRGEEQHQAARGEVHPAILQCRRASPLRDDLNLATEPATTP